ncbi:MAG: HAMP domain-containing sensor histidine kinase [Bacteroidota bacterium]
MENSIIRRIIILGAITIIGIIGIQSYWVMRTWDIKDQEFNQTVKLVLLNVANELERLSKRNSLPAKGLILQQSSNTYLVNINNEINADMLEYLLQRELEKSGLNVDFEYSIFDCESNEMVYGRYIDYQKDDSKGNPGETPQLLESPVDGAFDYYFSVRFPNRNSRILGDMRLVVFFSLILLLSIIFFIYSISVILRQKRLSEMQKDFINNMTHEFKTPISTIKISADVFLNHESVKSDDRLLRYANIVKEQNQRLNNQVEKVLQLAKIERESFMLNREQVDLHQLLRSIIESMELRIGEKKGALSSQLKAKNPIISADKLHLSNILHNLLDNAIKYCRQKPQIHLSTEEEDGNLLLSVSDQGIGIAAEHQQRVFNKFYRVPTGNVHNVKGFGLGLYYIKNVCDAHGWKLSLESEPNIGTTIRLKMHHNG